MEGNTQIVLLAGGRTKEAHLGNHRLLTPINGVPLLKRTIRQFNKWATIRVVTGDDQIKSAVRSQKNTMVSWMPDDPRYHQVDMIRKGLAFSYARRSIIVFGDVAFTDEAVETIRTNVADQWAVYGRSGASKVVGTQWAEYFAIEVDWAGRGLGRAAVETIADYYNRGDWHRASAWEWYRHMEGMAYHIENPAKVEVGPHWVEIDDATDDIDFAEDAERLQVAHAEA